MEKFQLILTTLVFLFGIGSIAGWFIELFYRRFRSDKNPERKWINPGFLVGPCLPLYGFGLIVLYGISSLPLLQGEDTPGKVVLTFVFMGVFLTMLEFLAGLIFIKGLKVKLWDYSECFGNVMGIICLRFSVYWTLLGAFYYYFLQQHILNMVQWLWDNPVFGFSIGVFFGIFLVDVGYSLNIVVRIRKFANEHQIIVLYEELQAQVKSIVRTGRKPFDFLFSLANDLPFIENLKNYEEKYRNTLEHIKQKTKRKKK
ncbi:MAG: putative ABC transporter permease [Lachnospiraceae bacterium]|nr:putative ABC transporter permease [Lachnospiraceae bacterium]